MHDPAALVRKNRTLREKNARLTAEVERLNAVLKEIDRRFPIEGRPDRRLSLEIRSLLVINQHPAFAEAGEPETNHENPLVPHSRARSNQARVGAAQEEGQ